MTNSFLRKLEGLARLSDRHRHEVEALTARTVRFGPRENMVQEGDEPKSVNVMMSGWACRNKFLADGRRQIVSLFLPGDMCDPYVFLLGAVDYGIRTLTPCTVAKVPAQTIREMTASGPELAEALWWQTLLAIEVQREWTLNLGRRTAVERVAHLFCEIVHRLASVGLSDGTGCDMPLTQTELADMLGLSTVHINRCMGELRASNLIVLHSKRLTLPNPQELMDLAGFDPVYLHRHHT